jgi:SPP1 family predicted phage head-tail adaptor
VNDILTLITTVNSVDDFGDPVISDTRREVFCGVASIGQKEFYQAQAVGLQPEIKFILADHEDYNGEQLVEYDGQRLRVLRTYRAGRQLELVCYREVNAS